MGYIFVLKISILIAKVWLNEKTAVDKLESICSMGYVFCV